MYRVTWKWIWELEIDAFGIQRFEGASKDKGGMKGAILHQSVSQSKEKHETLGQIEVH